MQLQELFLCLNNRQLRDDSATFLVVGRAQGWSQSLLSLTILEMTSGHLPFSHQNTLIKLPAILSTLESTFCDKIFNSSPNNAKSRVHQSLIYYLHTTHLGILKPSVRTNGWTDRRMD